MMKLSIFDIENWREIAVTLGRNKTRTLLTAFGIFWGVFMLACLMGGARGAQDILKRQFAGFATNSVLLVPGPTSEPYGGYAKGRTWQADLTDLQILKETYPQLDVATGQSLAGGISFRHADKSYSGTLTGSASGVDKVMIPLMQAGRFLNEADHAQSRKVAVVGKKIADEIFPGISDPTGRDLLINGINYKVIGIMYQTSEISLGQRLDDQVMIPMETFQNAFNRADKIDYILLGGKPAADFTALEPKIRQTLARRHTLPPGDTQALWYMNIAEQFEKVNRVFLGVSLLAFFIGFSTLVAGVIGIGNIMWVIVKERTQEFGIRRAIGAKPSSLTLQILLEGITLTAIAGMAAITLATIVLAVAAKLTTEGADVPAFQMSLGEAVQTMALFIVLGGAAGLIPAMRALKIKPIEALSSK